MITIEMLDYLGLFTTNQIEKGLRKWYAFDSDMLVQLKGCTKSVLILILLKTVIEADLDFEQFKKLLKTN